MWSLSQPPGHPDPPLAVWLPRRAGRQAVRPGGVQHWEGVPSQGTGGLGKLKALQTAGPDWDGGSGQSDIECYQREVEMHVGLVENIWGV